MMTFKTYAEEQLETRLAKRMRVLVSFYMDDISAAPSGRCPMKSWCYSAALRGQWMVRDVPVKLRWRFSDVVPLGDDRAKREFLFEHEAEALMFHMTHGGTMRSL